MDLILTQDFFPMVGGAHLWLYEVYKRWPKQVFLLTRDFSSDPILCKEQNAFDVLTHGSLVVNRENIFINEFNIIDPLIITRYIHIVRLINKYSNRNNICLHSIRAFPEGFAAALYKLIRLGKCKIITYAHGEEILTARTSRQLTAVAKLTYRLSDVIIANSKSTLRLLADFCPGHKGVVIHPGVDCASFEILSERRQEQRRKWGWSDDTVILTSIARMEPRKNHARVLAAVGALIKEGHSLAYVIAGDGEERDKLEAQVCRMGIEKWVRFLGKVSNDQKALIFASADIHVMPSVQVGPMIEGFGIVFLEAAAAGIPSIAGNIGGQREAVIEGKTGIITDGLEVDQILAAIRLLASDKGLRQSMGQAARKWAQENDWRNVVAKTISAVKR